ncbi:MAG: hypothetical protein AAB227_09420 [Pseudomonadota bacterium]
MAGYLKIAVGAAISLAAIGCEKPALSPVGERIDGPYVLTSEILSASPGKVICYQILNDGCDLRVPPPVVRLGWDENFISAAVRKIGEPDAVDYYYIVRDFDGPGADVARVVRGPYDEAAFIDERRKHGVPGVAPIGSAPIGAEPTPAN